MRKEKRHTPAFHSQETKNKIRLWNLGKKLSQETKNKIGESHKREKGSNWKSKNIGIPALHKRVRNLYTKINICEHCNLNKKTEWSNKNHKYNSEERRCWQELCRSCHIKYDVKHNNKKKINNPFGRKGRRLSIK